MQIHISHQDGTPIYQQIASQVKLLVSSGRLLPGEEIPPIRALAENLVINPNTVARAYLELERSGIVTKKAGSGTYVAENVSPLARRERRKILVKRIDQLLAEARHLDVSVDDLVDLVRERDETIFPTPK